MLPSNSILAMFIRFSYLAKNIRLIPIHFDLFNIFFSLNISAHPLCLCLLGSRLV